MKMFLLVVIPSLFFMIASASSTYTYYKDVGYYKYYSTEKSWYDAWTTCYNDHAQLVVINSEAERNLLIDLIASNNSPRYVIAGFHSLVNKNRIFVTVDGERLSELPYMKWKSGEPNNYFQNNEICGVYARDGRMNDIPCDDLRPFICEFSDSQNSVNFKN